MSNIEEIIKIIKDLNDWYNNGEVQNKETKRKTLSQNRQKEFDKIKTYNGKQFFLKMEEISEDFSLLSDGTLVGREYISTSYENLKKGIKLLEELREKMTGENIIYVSANQNNKKMTNIDELFSGFRETLQVSTSTILFYGEKGATETNFGQINSKIQNNIKKLEKLKQETQQIDNMKTLLYQLKNRLKIYDNILEMPPDSSKRFYTFYRVGKVESDDKDWIDRIKKSRSDKHMSKPYIKYQKYKERFSQWFFQPEMTGIEIQQMVRKNFFGVLVKDFSPDKDYTFYSENGYSFLGNKGNAFEAYLRGADKYRTDIDNLIEESKGNTPFFKGPDLRLDTLEVSIQAKAANATIKGQATFNEIEKILKGWNGLETSKQFEDFFLQHFFEKESNKEELNNKIKNYATKEQKNIIKFLGQEFSQIPKEDRQINIKNK